MTGDELSLSLSVEDASLLSSEESVESFVSSDSSEETDTLHRAGLGSGCREKKLEEVILVAVTGVTLFFLQYSEEGSCW